MPQRLISTHRRNCKTLRALGCPQAVRCALDEEERSLERDGGRREPQQRQCSPKVAHQGPQVLGWPAKALWPAAAAAAAPPFAQPLRTPSLRPFPPQPARAPGGPHPRGADMVRGRMQPETRRISPHSVVGPPLRLWWPLHSPPPACPAPLPAASSATTFLCAPPRCPAATRRAGAASTARWRRGVWQQRSGEELGWAGTGDARQAPISRCPHPLHPPSPSCADAPAAASRCPWACRPWP